MAAEVEEQLGWEAQQAPRAAIGAIAAGVATIASLVISAVAFRNLPRVTLAQGLNDALRPATKSGGLWEKRALFVNDRMWGMTAGEVISALGIVAMVIALGYLYRATRSRNPAFGQGALIAITIGGVASVVGILVSQIAVDVSVSSFAGAADHGTKAAHDALQPSAALAASLIRFIGQVALGLGMVLIALNAMRVGLLTRFMGILGVIVGVLLAFPLFGTAVVIQAFWLVMLGLLFVGRFPNGRPPAWETGRAEPWPTRQEMMEAQQAAKGGGRAPKDLPPPVEAEPAPVSEAAQHSRSKKKKRRR